MKLPKLEKNNKLFWLAIVGGIVSLILAFFFFPLWEKATNVFWHTWPTNAVNFVIAVFLVIYIALYLIKKIIRTKHPVVKTLTIIETVLMAAIVVYLIVGVFVKLDNLPLSQAGQILGLALYIRGVVEVFRAYYYRDEKSTVTDTKNAEKYPFWYVVVSIAFITLGFYLMIKNPISNIVISWIFDIALIICGIFLVVYGIYAKPRKK